MDRANVRQVSVIGAGGDMTGRFLKGLAGEARGDLRYRLYDLDEAAAGRRSAILGNEIAQASQLDLFNDEGLASAVQGADIVINGAGPFYRTADRVRRAALAVGAAYLDIDDDVESTLAGFELDEQARAAGTPIFIGCGASPGLTNVLALDLCNRLDEVERIDVAWCVGDEGPQEPGRSVIAHTLHMGAGDYVGWRDGGQVNRTSFAVARRISLPGLERQSFYECAHPEPVMLGRAFPGVRDVVCWGSLHPGPINGVLRGIAEAEREGRLTTDEAITYLQRQIAGEPGDKIAEREALRGMREQVRRGETTRAEFFGFLVRDALKLRYKTRAGTAAIVEGHRNGQRVRLKRFINSAAPESPLKRMDVSTGLAQAAFFLEAVDHLGDLAGCLTPEQWIEPARFYARFSVLLGVDTSAWLSPVEELVLMGEDSAHAAS